MTGRERILAMIHGEPVDQLPFMPITMMFAGDILGVPYKEYVTDYRVLAEGQIQTADAFDIDYVSCISDPAREAADCGAKVHFFPNQPPAIDEYNALLANKALLAKLSVPDPLACPRMRDRVDAAALLAHRVGTEKLVEGWVEGPCAEAADLRGINTLMMDFYEDPGFAKDLMGFCLELGLRFARAQVEAGCDLIGVGDAAASLIGPQLYEEYVWPFEKRLVDGIHDMGGLVRLHICGNTNPLLRKMGQLKCDIVDLDYMVSIPEARKVMGANQVLLGNLDPVSALRNGTPGSIREAVKTCYREAGPRYIIGAGCEVVRDTPHENLRALHYIE